ncbi:MAG: hypothetical protein ACYSX0_04395 [Planctomycetota bacterium]|jgi:hypothetical protein
MKLTTRYGEGMNHGGPCWPLWVIINEDYVIVGDGEYSSFKEQGLL